MNVAALAIPKQGLPSKASRRRRARTIWHGKVFGNIQAGFAAEFKIAGKVVVAQLDIETSDSLLRQAD